MEQTDNSTFDNHLQGEINRDEGGEEEQKQQSTTSPYSARLTAIQSATDFSKSLRKSSAMWKYLNRLDQRADDRDPSTAKVNTTQIEERDATFLNTKQDDHRADRSTNGLNNNIDTTNKNNNSSRSKIAGRVTADLEEKESSFHQNDSSILTAPRRNNYSANDLTMLEMNHPDTPPIGSPSNPRVPTSSSMKRVRIQTPIKQEELQPDKGLGKFNIPFVLLLR